MIGGYLDNYHRGSGSTPSNSYFWPLGLGVLPVLLYHFCGSATPNVCFLAVWECSHKYYTTFVGVLALVLVGVLPNFYP